MQSNTISVSPVPLETTVQKIRSIFQAFSVKNVHIDFPRAYVEFDDEGDLENLDIQFENYEVPELSNAKIDKSEFNWNSIKKESTSPDKKSDSSSSDKNQDLMAADIENLVIVENCDELFLKNLSQENIRKIFKDFNSINRIVKRKKDVILQFTHAGEMEQLQAKFPNLNVPELGQDSVIEKAEPTKIKAEDFVSEWSKFYIKQPKESKETSHLGYQDEKLSSRELLKSKDFELGSYDSKPSSQEVLHQDIIPPFDKKTSMEVNFLNEQSKLGYKEQKSHQPIHEASTHQELDYTTEIKIEADENEDRFGELVGYEVAEKERSAEVQRKKKEEERLERERKEKEERERNLNEEKERQRQRQEERKIEKEQREKQRKEDEQKLRKQQEQRKRLMREEQQDQRKRQEQSRRKQEQERARVAEQKQKKRRQAELLDKELKEKLQIQRQKYQKQEEERRRKQKEHHIPTESQNAAQEAEIIREAGKTIQQQLGYAVNKAKQESANLVNAGLEILRGHEKKSKDKLGYNSSTKEETFDVKKGAQKSQMNQEAKNVQKLGYEKQPKQAGLDLLNSSFQFLKGSYNKIQEQIGTVVTKAKEASNPSELGYEKWTVKPDVQVPKPIVGQQPRVLKTLITITLLIWVIFLLMQDTSVSEIEIGLPTVEKTQEEFKNEASNA